MSNSTFWSSLSVEIGDWAQRNFGGSQSWQTYLGLIEEIGEFLECEESSGWTAEKAVDSLADQTIYVLNLCQTMGIQFPFIPIPVSPSTNGDLFIALGRGAKALLKNSQGIRGYDWPTTQLAMMRTLVTWIAWVDFKILYYGLPELHEMATKVWSQVKERNWKDNPNTGTST